jgi:hypothetical protein
VIFRGVSLVHRLLYAGLVEPLSVFMTSPAGISSLTLDRSALAPSLAPARLARACRARLGDRIVGLLVLNLAIQIFDGVATYVGIENGIREGNPLVAAAMRGLGTGSGLALAKLAAILLLALLYRRRHDRWVGPGLTVLAVSYIWLSVVPWTLILSTL